MSEMIIATVNEGLDKLYSVWTNLGLDVPSKMDRNQTIRTHIKTLLTRMLTEEIGAKDKILKSLKIHTKKALKLAKELGMKYTEPDNSMVLIQYEKYVRQEASRMEHIKAQRLNELGLLEEKYATLCKRLGKDPDYIPSNEVPPIEHINNLEEHIKSLEVLKEQRMKKFLSIKENILFKYEELEIEPNTALEREIACEDEEFFILSITNLDLSASVLSELEHKKILHKKMALESADKIESLYEMLKMDQSDKNHFLAENEGYTTSVIEKLNCEIDRLEMINKEQVGEMVEARRKELKELWEKCFYSQEQRSQFVYFCCDDFTKELLELHQEEIRRISRYFEEHKDLLDLVWQWKKMWINVMELDRRLNDPARLMSRRNSLIKEEQQRNDIYKMLTKIEHEISEKIEEWEQEQERRFLVGGVTFSKYIQEQKEKHANIIKLGKKNKSVLDKKQNNQHGDRLKVVKQDEVIPKKKAEKHDQGYPIKKNLHRMPTRNRKIQKSLSPMQVKILKRTKPRIEKKKSKVSTISEMESSKLNQLKTRPLTRFSWRERNNLLKSSGVPNLDRTERDELKLIRESRQQCGCNCQDECLPGICSCIVNQMECQVETEGYPCKCKRKICGNPLGKKEYDVDNVQMHYMQTLMQVQNLSLGEEVEKNNKTNKIGFKDVSVYYFERAQGLSSVPDEGGNSLGMEMNHFFHERIRFEKNYGPC